MKRYRAFAFLIVVVSSRGLSAQASVVQAGAAASEAVARERALWDLLKRNDFGGFDSSVKGMMFVGATGMVREWKDGLAEQFFKGCDLRSFTLDSMQATPRGQNLVVLSYRATTNWTCNGTPMPSPTYESAVWQRIDGTWRVLFGGSTPVAPK